MDKIDILSLTDENKYFFVTTLKKELCERFDTPVEELPELYGYAKPWSLLNLVESGNIDAYQLLYVNDKIWTGSGGMIREFQGEKVYQSGFRAFSVQEHRHTGLGVNAYMHQYSSTLQIDRAKKTGCAKVIWSFDPHNYRLFKVNYRYLIPKAFPNYKFIVHDEPVEFNYSPQHLIILDLKENAV
jgi:hypothetical protein